MSKRKTILRNRTLDFADIKRLARERKALDAKKLAVEKMQRADKIDRQFLTQFFKFPDTELSKGMNARVWRLRNMLKDATLDQPKLRRFVYAIVRKGNDLLVADYWTKLEVLIKLKWHNDPETWKPKGKSVHTRFRSLADHLVIKYPIPRALYCVFENPYGRVAIATLKCFERITAGDSIYKVMNGDLFSVKLSKKMCHVFAHSKQENIVWAAREAQLTCLNAKPEIISAILGTFLGRNFTGQEQFWLQVFQWMANLKDYDRKQIGPLIDYLNFLKGADEKYTIKGRSYLALIRGMEEWHKESNKTHRVKHVDFQPSKFQSGIYETNLRLPNGCHLQDIWTVEEILSSSELSTEGAKMRHCVFLYTSDIMCGESSIWTMRKNGHRALTIELENQTQEILQVRGKTNRIIRKEEKAILDQWVKENALKYDKYCFEE